MLLHLWSLIHTLEHTIFADLLCVVSSKSELTKVVREIHERPTKHGGLAISNSEGIVKFQFMVSLVLENHGLFANDLIKLDGEQNNYKSRQKCGCKYTATSIQILFCPH
ncbi:hypothetical protein GJ496_009313 [Pomphorhynchus laevis]|nr:hypothetical protein GJ496_009313 [Pomphorhynchus laevis]